MLTTILYSIVGVLAFDWLFMGKITAGFADFDYRYWPLTWARSISLTLAAITAALSGIFFTPSNMPVWPIFVWALVFALWLGVAIDEMARQRAVGYRAPPRYSDRDEA